MRGGKVIVKLMGILVLICAAATAAGAQQTPKTLTLAQALDMANRQNLDLVAARAQRAVSAAGVKIAGERPNPTGNFTALRDDPHEGWWFDVPFELGSKRKRRIELARAQGVLTNDDVAALERLIRQSVRDAFFGLALARGATAQKNDAVKLAQRLHDIAQQRYDAGDVPQLEVFQADLVVSQAQADYQVAQQDEKVALSALNALLNEPPVTNWTLLTPLDALPAEPSLSDLLARAANSNSQLQRIAQQEQIEQSQRALYQADRIPNLTVQLGMDYNSPHNFRYGPRSQVSMEVPIFMRYQGEIAQSNASLLALEDQAAATRRAVDGRIESAYFQLDSREEQARLYGKSLVPAAAKLESLAEESYRAGKANILSVLNAQQNVQQVQQKYLQSLYAVHQAFAQLEATVGVPLD
ncbi:MAG TPA: TolC family protein [Candidatus Limnocylindrales bacterium]|nr:TolC family protein [Candidatus Limnocylindrales bacterium]